MSNMYQIVEKENLNMLEFHNILSFVDLSEDKVIMSICSITMATCNTCMVI